MINVLLLILLLTSEERIVRTSIYHPVKSQCNSIDPTITASGIRINVKELNAEQIRYVSISRDLRKHYKYGTYITIKSNKPYYNGKWKVVDTMNKRFKLKIDFLQGVRNRHVPPNKVTISKWKKT